VVDYNALLSPGMNPGAAFSEGVQARQQSQYQQQRMNALAQQQDQERQQNSLAMQDRAHKQELAGAAQVANAPSPKAAAEQIFPDYVRQLGADWANVSDDQVRQHAQQIVMFGKQQLGIVDPGPITSQNYGGVNALLQDGKVVHAANAPRPDHFYEEQDRLDARQKSSQTFQSGQTASKAPSEDQIDLAAKAIANYQQQPLGSMAMRAPYGQAVMARVMELNPDYQANEYGARNKAYKDFSTGKNGNQVRSFNVAISHLDSLEKAADALGNGDMQAFNKLGNSIAKATGKAAPNNFDGMKKIVTDEIVKAIVGAGGGVADREEASKTISSANSPAQLIGIMNSYRDLMAGQLNGLQQQYEQSTGRKDFQRLLSPESIQYLESHQNAAAPAAATNQAPQAAIDYLRANPQFKDAFKAKYGYLP